MLNLGDCMNEDLAFIYIACYIKPVEMHLHPALKQISLILLSDLDTSKGNALTPIVNSVMTPAQHTGSL